MSSQNVDLQLVARILRHGELKEAYRAGIRAEYIEGAAREIWTFLEDYFRRYGTIPDVSTVEQRYGVEIPDVRDPAPYWVSELIDRSLHHELQELAIGIDGLLAKAKPREALDKLRGFLREQNTKAASGLNLIDAFDLVDEVKRRYLEAKSGKFGIKTPWTRMDDMTLGWWPEDVSFFVARTGVGKTWISLICTLAAWKSINWQAGECILYISGEMSAEDVAGRLFSIETRKQHGAIRKGKLAAFHESTWFEQLEALRQCKGIKIRDGKMGLTSMDVDVAIEQSGAKLVVVDSAYRVKTGKKVKDRSQNMAEVADDLKTSAQRHKVPILGTTQLNRDSTKKKNGSVGTEDIAQADAIGWNSTNIFGLSQTKEQKEVNVMGIVPVKVREGENSRDEFLVNWDFIKMNFDEAPGGKGYGGIKTGSSGSPGGFDDESF